MLGCKQVTIITPPLNEAASCRLCNIRLSRDVGIEYCMLNHLDPREVLEKQFEILGKMQTSMEFINCVAVFAGRRHDTTQATTMTTGILFNRKFLDKWQCLQESIPVCFYLGQIRLHAGNNTESEVDMKKAKKITVIYYRIKGKPKEIKVSTGY